MKELMAAILLLLSLALSSCRDAQPLTGVQPPPSAAGVYIVNEGGFSGGASLSYYDAKRDTVFNNVVGSSANWVFPNDMKIIGAKGYIAVNGSDRIDVMDLDSNRIIKSIHAPQYSGPGYITTAGSLLLVANYSGSMSVVSLGTDSLILTTPAVVTFPGGIASTGSKVFISDFGTYVNNQFVPGHLVKVLDPVSGVVVDSISVGDAPGAMTLLNGRLVVVCTGTQSVSPRLIQIDPSSGVAEDSLQITGAVSDIGNDGKNIFVLSSNSVGKFAIQPLRAIQEAFIPRTAGLYFYSLGVDESTGDIYVTNVVGSAGAGRLEIYTSPGSLKRPPETVGIFPGALAFYMTP